MRSDLQFWQSRGRTSGSEARRSFPVPSPALAGGAWPRCSCGGLRSGDALSGLKELRRVGLKECGGPAPTPLGVTALLVRGCEVRAPAGGRSGELRSTETWEGP